MAEHGILIEGEPLTGSRWCRRDPDAWWDPSSAADRYQMRPRSDVLDLLCGHWTAGEAGSRSYYDDGPIVVRRMKARMSRRRPGQRLKVSVQFVIGACAPEDEFAPVWQTMDLGGEWTAVHVGRGPINARSIGVEVVNAGLDGRANVRHRPEVEVRLRGEALSVLAFYPGQLRTWVRLANALAGSCLPGGIEIPRSVPAQFLRMDPTTQAVDALSRRFSGPELRRWSGAMEHFQMPGTTKIDAGALLLRALLRAGWSSIAP